MFGSYLFWSLACCIALPYACVTGKKDTKGRGQGRAPSTLFLALKTWGLLSKGLLRLVFLVHNKMFDVLAYGLVAVFLNDTGEGGADKIVSPDAVQLGSIWDDPSVPGQELGRILGSEALPQRCNGAELVQGLLN